MTAGHIPTNLADMIGLNIHEANTNLSALVRGVEERGETVILQRHGRPIAEIHAHGSSGGGRHRLTLPREGLDAALLCAAADLPPIHHDPFDRIPVATAIRERMALLTPDRTYALYAVATIW